MSDVKYQESWKDEATQCKNCASFQSKNNKNTCVPENKTFEDALEEYGEVSPSGHCNFFKAK